MTELLLAIAATSGLFHKNVCVVRKAVVVKEIVQVKQVYQPVATLFLVAPPSYYAAPQYTPPPRTTAESACATGTDSATDKKIVDVLSTLTIAVTRLEQRLDRIEGRPAVERVQPVPDPLPPPEPTPAGLDETKLPIVIRQSCSLCHGEGSEGKGGFFLSDLADPSMLKKSLVNVESGKMPRDAEGHSAIIPLETRALIVSALKEMQGAE